MDQLTKNTSSKPKRKVRILCNECNKKRSHLDEDHQICHICHKAKTRFKPSGSEVIDDFIKYTLINNSKPEGKMEFVPYNKFKDVEFIAEGGFSKIYKATWVDGPVSTHWSVTQCYLRRENKEVVLKKLNNSKDITSKELNEVNEYSILLIL
jgi:hypothetical protein